MKKTFKSSSFYDISKFPNGFVWNPLTVQRSLFVQIVRFLEEKRV